MSKLQYSLRTVAITATVFCCLLAYLPQVTKAVGYITGFPVDYKFPDVPPGKLKSYEVAGLWIHSNRFLGRPKPMIGFVYERRKPLFEAYYVCVWCYEKTGTPAAVVYTVYPEKDVGVHLQTMPKSWTKGWQWTTWLCGLFVILYPVLRVLIDIVIVDKKQR